jgi:AraC family transcriptional regulator
MLAPTLRLRARLGNDEPREFDALTGQIVINPANVESSWEWPSILENAIVAITEPGLRELAEQEFNSGDAELVPPPFGTLDTTALTIAQLLKADLTRGEGGSELYADTLITLFGVHLLRNYTLRNKPPRQIKGGLGRDAARKVRDYLNENFTRQMSVKELAAIVDLSPKHFIQAFTRTFGAAPHRYLLDLRLDFAEKLLLGGDLAIAEVAYLSGFSSQSHLTATMKQHRRTTPTQLRAAP